MLKYDEMFSENNEIICIKSVIFTIDRKEKEKQFEENEIANESTNQYLIERTLVNSRFTSVERSIADDYVNLIIKMNPFWNWMHLVPVHEHFGFVWYQYFLFLFSFSFGFV